MTKGSEPTRGTLPPPVRGMRAAFVFLSRLPFGGFPYRDEDFAWAPAHSPLVGLVVGGLGAAAFAATAEAGPTAAAIFGLAVTMFATGGFHEDGLADTADGLGGAIFDRERVLAILKDSRIGAYGALALVVTVGLRTALIAAFSVKASAGATSLAAAGAFAFVTSHVAARVTPTLLMGWMPYVTDEAHAKSRPIVRAGAPQSIVAAAEAAVILAICMALFPTSSFAAVLSGVTAAAAGMLVCAYRFHKRIGGITGDFLGATEQVAEMAFLLALTCTI